MFGMKIYMGNRMKSTKTLGMRMRWKDSEKHMDTGKEAKYAVVSKY